MPCFAVLYCVVLYTNPTLIAVLGTPDASDFPELAKEAGVTADVDEDVFYTVDDTQEAA